MGHNPSRAVELFGYQRLICSANTLLPVRSWLQYDSKFHTLAAADPLLRWDQRHPDLWLECLASVQQNAKQITSLAIVCKLLFAKNKIHQITAEHQITSKDPPIQLVECSIKDTAPVKPALISTSAFPVKVNTPGPSAQEGKLPLVSPYGKAPLRPLTLECESSLTQVHLSMTSESTLLNSELILPTYSRPLDHVYDLPCDASTSQLPIFSPKHDSLPNDCYFSEPRSLLIECESNPSLEVSPNEHHLTPDLAPSN